MLKWHGIPSLLGLQMCSHAPVGRVLEAVPRAAPFAPTSRVHPPAPHRQTLHQVRAKPAEPKCPKGPGKAPGRVRSRRTGEPRVPPPRGRGRGSAPGAPPVPPQAVAAPAGRARCRCPSLGAAATGAAGRAGGARPGRGALAAAPGRGGEERRRAPLPPPRAPRLGRPGCGPSGGRTAGHVRGAGVGAEGLGGGPGAPAARARLAPRGGGGGGGRPEQGSPGAQGERVDAAQSPAGQPFPARGAGRAPRTAGTRCGAGGVCAAPRWHRGGFGFGFEVFLLIFFFFWKEKRVFVGGRGAGPVRSAARRSRAGRAGFDIHGHGRERSGRGTRPATAVPGWLQVPGLASGHPGPAVTSGRPLALAESAARPLVSFCLL